MRFRSSALLAIVITTLVQSIPLYAWGEAGHKIVAEIAQHELDKDIFAKIEEALDGASFEDASVWMDNVRKEPRYYHMAKWHYINLEKGEVFAKNKEENVVNELRRVVKKLNNRKKYSQQDTARHLKILFHLIGDLHQPLHTGYGSDRGGNNVPVEFNDKATNLHGLWDYEIIAAKGITIDDCLQLKTTMSAAEIKAIQKLNVVEWFKESRAYVESAYKIGDGKITDAYVEKNVQVMKSQMLKAGIRLAAILTRLYKNSSVEEKEKDKTTGTAVD